jgi:hypothetical protein
MLWSSIRYEVAFQDFAEWDFHMLTPHERRTYMTSAKSNHLAQRLNAVEQRPIFANKLLFNGQFAPYIGREYLDLRTCGVNELGSFTSRHARVVAKVADGLGGQGIDVFSTSDLTDLEAFKIERLAQRQVLLEQFLIQHSTMMRLNPTSVNTLRIVTYLDKAHVVHTLARVLKIGNGGDVDNFKAGGMYTLLDEQGVVQFPAIDGGDRVFEVHPVTGTPIVGFEVPNWLAVLNLVDTIAQEVPRIRYVGWDIAITPEGAAVIEGNYNTGVFQLKPSATGVRRGSLPLYRSVIGF